MGPNGETLIENSQILISTQGIKGCLKPDRGKDELTYAPGMPEHTERVRGMGVVPWKHGFSGDIKTYQSRCRRKAEKEENMRALEE
jgi:hypothetical protein